MTIELHERIKNLLVPRHMRGLPLNDKGWIVPRFVLYENAEGKQVPFGSLDGKPDFRIMDAQHLARCVMERVCWICGGTLGRYLSFVIGPMCAINRVSAEPPSHLDCATYAAMACPFLTMPKMIRRDDGLPENMKSKGKTVLSNSGAGEMIVRNPGVALVWVCISYRATRDKGGVLFRVGEALSTHWYCEGREASRDEVLHSIETGLPALVEMAEKQDREEPGAGAVAALTEAYKDALLLIPDGMDHVESPPRPLAM